jgi:hypothetical protein
MSLSSSGAAYWITPVKSERVKTADKIIKTLVIAHRVYRFSAKTYARHSIKTGDWICFYANGKGVVAHARVASEIALRIAKTMPHYPYVVKLDRLRAYLNTPILLDFQTRAKLDAFAFNLFTSNWAWLVQTTRRITKHDFECLTSKRD